MKALTLNELRQMVGQPVWCPKENAYGIITCDKYGKWAGIPFLYGVCKYEESTVEFNHNIVSRKLKCFKIEDKKEIPMKLLSKVDDCGNKKNGMPELPEGRDIYGISKNISVLPLVRTKTGRRGHMKIWTEEKLIEEGYEIRNAQIKGAELTMEHCGCISLDVVVEGAGWGCIFGGYSLGHGYLGAKEFSGYGPGMESIARIMDTVGVTKLSDLEGKYIRAAVTGDRRLKIIGNIINNKWFDIESFFKDAQANDKEVSEGSNK